MVVGALAEEIGMGARGGQDKFIRGFVPNQ